MTDNDWVDTTLVIALVLAFAVSAWLGVRAC